MKTMLSSLRVLWVPVLMMISSGSGAQTPPPAPAAPTAAVPPSPPPPPCTRAENRQFDFWIGDWDVTTPDGKPAGTNLIKPILNGCVLHENWKGRGGFTGESFNVYDAKRKVWHQTWVDGTGSTLMMDGVFANGSMTLSDKDVPGKADRNAINEIVWTSNTDGTVRQLWRTSSDGGKTWSTAFDGRYVKSPRPQPKL